ncbi:STAS domain-containing protein [Rugosimonospora africana]|uniref:Anti-anti-sigma factor n=1 Tax=Rugosimonospora africana TaxID=556532 RepID=A0A8J3VV17_9ACTN|nr:STAS domain-containing protein [Rugosimonospora africana]GIH19810.1 anti-anti-sigma factor [Rugosimonospora africana]
MTTPLHITTSQAPDGRPRLTAVGEIDISNTKEFTAKLCDAVAPGHRLLVDLTLVTYLDSAALAALFAYAKQIDIHISPLNETLFSFSGLSQLTTIRVIPADQDQPSSAG